MVGSAPLGETTSPEGREVVMRKWIVGVVSVLAVGCVARERVATASGAELLNTSRTQTFDNGPEAEAAWGRAQVAVNRYSNMKIQVATDYLVETYNPIDYGDFGCAVERSPISGERTSISARCVAHSPWHDEEAKIRGKKIMWFVERGTSPPAQIYTWREKQSR